MSHTSVQITRDFVTVVAMVDGNVQVKSVQVSAPNFKQIKNLAEAFLTNPSPELELELRSWVLPITKLKHEMCAQGVGGLVRCHKNMVVLFDPDSKTWCGAAQTVAKYILQEASNNRPISAVYNFWLRVKNNPLADSLFKFMKDLDICILQDGTFVGYRAVRNNYRDKHTNTMDNSVGNIVQEDKSVINTDPNVGCGRGLHVGTLYYALDFGNFKGDEGDRLLAVQVDPADVMSVPKDYCYQKMRVCQFFVVTELDPEVAKRHGGLVEVKQAVYQWFNSASNTQIEWDEGEEPEPDEEPGDLGRYHVQYDLFDSDKPNEVKCASPESTTCSTSPSVLSDVATRISRIAAANTINSLRKRAKEIGVKNVNSIPGGKRGLVVRCLEVDPNFNG